MKFTYAVVTVSDTCFNNTAEDRSGPALVTAVQENFANAMMAHKLVVPDELDRIVASLQMLCNSSVNLILTTGGTGLSKRDVTPEATKQVIEKEVPGITQTMLIRSLEITDMAMLSRTVAGTKQNSLIINLPGSQKGAVECFGFIKSVIPHAIQLILDQKDEIKAVHQKEQSAGEGEATLKSKVRIDQVAMRNRTSPYAMIGFEEALKIVCEQSVNLDDIEEISIESSLNRVLAADVISTDPFPPFRASIKDGYAVRAEDESGERIVRNSVAAGDDLTHSTLQPNEVVRISTGACVPEGADAVVQVEDTDLLEADEKGNEIRIMIKTTPTKGQDIREIGSDIPAKTTIFKRKETISPAHIGVFTMLGYFRVKVFRRPFIGLLSTGNEVCPYNMKEIPSGHIRDSNKITLLNLLQKYSYTATDLGLVRDNPDLLKRALVAAFQRHNVVITTGGVSMGEFDLMKEILEKDFDATIHFGRVDMKPGKPTTFATCRYRGIRKLIFALPGNPVSATVTCTLLVVPALRSYECSTIPCCRKLNVSTCESMIADDRLEFRRVRLAYHGFIPDAHEMGNQISSRLNSCAGADALLVVPSKKNGPKAYPAEHRLSAYIL